LQPYHKLDMSERYKRAEQQQDEHGSLEPYVRSDQKPVDRSMVQVLLASYCEYGLCETINQGTFFKTTKERAAEAAKEK